MTIWLVMVRKRDGRLSCGECHGYVSKRKAEKWARHARKNFRGLGLGLTVRVVRSVTA
jgi:hypothetical protein